MRREKLSLCFGLAVGAILTSFYHVYSGSEISPKVIFKDVSEEKIILTPAPSEGHSFMEFMHIMEAQQTERRTTLSEACRRIKQDFQFMQPVAKYFNLFSDHYKFTVCDINKCGSSSWLRAILIMDGYFTVDDQVNHRIHGDEVIQMANKKARLQAKKNGTEIKRVWNEYLNIITVRNPFQRIVSAYSDKMRPQSKGFTYVYGPLSKQINQQFKKLRYLEEDRNKDDETASFEDFVNFLLYSKEPQANDPHWRSFDQTCAPCTYEYDFIMKFETMTEDTAYLKQRLNISKEHGQIFFPVHRRRVNDTKTEEYFRKIPLALSKALYAKYKIDFELFGYPMPYWLC
ncbi:carbohydrate sulfotransferase 12-like [Clavelina lepadiformis]|uniref:carbohydrate sulfotransferase 12-like n=1 Tax=Clavelina lepadiformis TaxID=159417 RepID=UPI00404232C6